MSDDEEYTKVTCLSPGERRVLGTLVEKGLTTPDQYPLTLKGCTTGCNQKNNRDPVTSYDEDKVSDFLEKLREKGLVAEVFTDGARVAKYRHYMRKRTPLTEAQLAIFCELLLRGRQQPGELRTRAGRMCEIPTQEQLRTELNGLMELGYIRANGPLDRRGVEVDHTWYEPREGQTMPAAVLEAAPVATPVSAAGDTGGAGCGATRSVGGAGGGIVAAGGGGAGVAEAGGGGVGRSAGAGAETGGGCGRATAGAGGVRLS